jgi:hypothetical protein
MGLACYGCYGKRRKASLIIYAEISVQQARLANLKNAKVDKNMAN